MKKILIILLFVCNSSYAEEWLEMANNAGGKIMLLTSACSSGNGRLVIGTSKDGTSMNGCWFFFSDMVHIVWSSGALSSFYPKEFVTRESK